MSIKFCGLPSQQSNSLRWENKKYGAIFDGWYYFTTVSFCPYEYVLGYKIFILLAPTGAQELLIFVCLFVRFTLVCQLAVIHMSFIQLRLVFFLIIFQISSCRTFFPFLKGPQSFFCKTVCSHQSMILRTQNNLEIKIHHSTIFFVIILGHFTSFFP